MSGSDKTESDSKTSPWAPQAGALTDAFGQAKTALGKANGATAPTDFLAQFNPAQLQTFRSMLGFANNNGVPGANAATGSTMANAGAAGATGALTGLQNYNPNATNNPQSVIDAANKYVAGQDINGQVNASMQGAREQARDITMPGIEQNAATSGNTNSSRTGIAQGIVERGLAEQSAGLGATLRNNAFQNGLNLAQNQAAANNEGVLSALTARGNLGNSVANSGINAGSQSINDQGKLFDMANAGGSGLQASDQANLTNQLQRYQFGVSSPYDALNGYMGIIGSNNWGSEGHSTTTSTPSAWSVIGGLMGAGGSLANGIGSFRKGASR